MPSRKKRGAAPPPRAIERPRPIAAGEKPTVAYPSARQALASEACRALVDKAVRLAAGAGLVALGAQLAGCAEPTCEATRYGELDYHGHIAFQAVVESHDLRFAAEELGMAVGVVDHPPFHPGAMAGAMIMPAPTLGGPPPIAGGPGNVDEALEALGLPPVDDAPLEDAKPDETE